MYPLEQLGVCKTKTEVMGQEVSCVCVCKTKTEVMGQELSCVCVVCEMNVR